MSKKHWNVAKHLVVAAFVVAAGAVIAAASPSPAASQSGCGQQICVAGPNEDSCDFSYNNWYCDFETPGSCVTEACGPGGPCEGHECQT